MLIAPWYLNFFNNITTVQFDHRAIAWVLAVIVPLFWWSVRTTAEASPVSGFVELPSDTVMPTTERKRGQKAGPAEAAEKQLVQLLLGDPALVPLYFVARVVKP